MTNEQTAVMLQLIANNLRDAISEADMELENVPRQQIKTYIGNPLKVGLIPPSEKERPELYLITEGDVMALMPLRQVLNGMENHINGLLLEHPPRPMAERK